MRCTKQLYTFQILQAYSSHFSIQRSTQIHSKSPLLILDRKMSVNFCSVCRLDKSDSKWRNISEKEKEKAELVGNYELKISEKICSKL